MSAGRQLNAIFALALLAAPSVRGCPMKAHVAIFLAEALQSQWRRFQVLLILAREAKMT
jgi:hypothetical protein